MALGTYFFQYWLPLKKKKKGGRNLIKRERSKHQGRADVRWFRPVIEELEGDVRFFSTIGEEL